MGSIMLFSDIHADIGALDAILRLSESRDFGERYGQVSLTVNMGDVLERGHDPGPVIDRLEGMSNIESILGNHDEAFIGRIPVSGSDRDSERAHEAYRATGRYQRFFQGMGKYYIDTKEKLYVVHGGPVDPCAITPREAEGVEAWIYTQPWQRISDIGIRYVDGSGYHYLPADAFDAVKPVFNMGFAIICGHEHSEAAYRLKGGAVEDIYGSLEETEVDMGGVEVLEKRLPIEEDAAFLIRLGLAGPEGYDGGRCRFGVYTRKGGRAICLLNIPG
ncbi:MAG TPA: metallophosphoesterase [Methanocella sp.]|uniref:metallophosphoesterase family protein n=1 Tax=Methanocella sp. TaxID=2052833 RepID=UPI002C435FD5|nr:metallophosphoesterase [Methanocella sp.]HTY89968.1 metallophosphoesterase [Methanocella sp.]